MLAMFLLYRPGAFFATLSIPFFLLSAALGIRFIVLIYFVNEVGRTHIPSLILLAISAFAGFALLLLAIVGNLFKSQRRLAEEQIYLTRHLMIKK